MSGIWAEFAGIFVAGVAAFHSSKTRAAVANQFGFKSISKLEQLTLAKSRRHCGKQFTPHTKPENSHPPRSPKSTARRIDRPYNSVMRLLVVEDEPKTAAALRKGFAEKGYEVDLCLDGAEASRLARTGDYQLLVLDIMLPGRDGWSILSELRAAGVELPVVVLTARDAVRDRVKGLSLGADDYLIKPFAFAELLARVQSVLRRASGTMPATVRIADLELDFAKHKASRNGSALDLTPKEFALLAFLARHRGEPQTRATLASAVWDMPHEGESNVVDVHVRRLRAKVDDPFEHKLIQTVRGVGYVLRDDA
jgi:two-component system copper resistance phosphate regulon response regulator CusR